MTTREPFDLEREVHHILFDVMDLTVCWMEIDRLKKRIEELEEGR